MFFVPRVSRGRHAYGGEVGVALRLLHLAWVRERAVHIKPAPPFQPVPLPPPPATFFSRIQSDVSFILLGLSEAKREGFPRSISLHLSPSLPLSVSLCSKKFVYFSPTRALFLYLCVLSYLSTRELLAIAVSTSVSRSDRILIYQHNRTNKKRRDRKAITPGTENR